MRFATSIEMQKTNNSALNYVKTIYEILKMTNKEVSLDQGDRSNPRVASFLAVHLVSQVLDEAYIIANAARETGQPWRNLSMLKNFNSSRLGETYDEELSFVASKGDGSVLNENKMQLAANVVATSTPQKVSGATISDEFNLKNESYNIGQGDEELETSHNELTQSTSMFINHLFDMSEVERVIICDDNEIMLNEAQPDELITQAMSKIMESYVNIALGISAGIEAPMNDIKIEPKPSISTEHSDYSFLTDAFIANASVDVGFYIDDNMSCENEDNFEPLETTSAAKVNEQIEETFHFKTVEVKHNEDAVFENAYLTLNRDYDQCSEDDGDPILQDPKGLTMQEVELLTASVSDDHLFSFPEPQQRPKDLAAPSAISTEASGSLKSSLLRRCRTQGARMLACMRSLWRRKALRKRIDARVPGSARGLCPMSPAARCRASSSLDHRLLRSPSPSRPDVWKFNTINEALVNSSRWKEYTFDMKPDVCGETNDIY